MKYRVTWTVEVDAATEDEALVAGRRYLLANEGEALAKIVPIEEGSSPPGVPHVHAR